MKQLRIKLIIWITLTVLGIVASVVVIFLTNQKILSTTAAIQGLQSQSTASDAAIRNLIGAQRQSANLAEQLTTLQTAFIKNDNPLPYLTQLEELATSYGVTLELDIVEGSATVLPTGIRIMPTVVTIIGPWQNDVAFINAMMQEPIYFNSTDLDIDGSAATDANFISITLHGNMYWQ